MYIGVLPTFLKTKHYIDTTIAGKISRKELISHIVQSKEPEKLTKTPSETGKYLVSRRLEQSGTQNSVERGITFGPEIPNSKQEVTEQDDRKSVSVDKKVGSFNNSIQICYFKKILQQLKSYNKIKCPMFR